MDEEKYVWFLERDDIDIIEVYDSEEKLAQALGDYLVAELDGGTGIYDPDNERLNMRFGKLEVE